ncbi:hypothetical protein C7457_1714 [Thermovibrio guaymasensis]|uniref:Uncharacterized protein n=1 Tax=Thermovibrio guaymasensis TaxID=240167 RepID=A0A420W5G9_9BACT|nr:hypothetical protein [Thermovibrio guaymasensis]RKQ59926.1 hypothetical protein C7457_1714 [Thermovibrio guaymasensis]
MKDFDFEQLNDDTKVLIVKFSNDDYVNNTDVISGYFDQIRSILSKKDIEVIFISDHLELLHLSKTEMKELFKK